LMGATVETVGVLPTPAIAYFAKTTHVSLGAVISASHNPFEDNGIKVFSGAGHKFTEERERQVGQAVADSSRHIDQHEAPAVKEVDRRELYLAGLRDILPDLASLRGTRLVVDCANGATTTVAPALFTSLGFDVTLIGAEPDGRNINRGVGSTQPREMAEMV